MTGTDSPEAPRTDARPAALVRQLVKDVCKRQGMLEKQLAGRMGISPRTLRNWLGRTATWQAHEVTSLADALELTGDHRTNLYLLTGHMPPAPPVRELRRTPEMAVYQQMIDGLEHPSVVYSVHWEVVLMNDAFREVFGGVRRHTMAHPTHNTQKFILFHPDAPLLLGAGDTDAFREQWLLPSLAVFSAVLEQQPEDPKLLAMLAEIKRRPAVHRAYQSVPGWIAANGDIVIKPIPRLFWDPRVGRVVRTRIITESHLGYMATTLQRATFVIEDSARPVPAPPPACLQLSLFDVHGPDRAAAPVPRQQDGRARTAPLSSG
ncbi:hypothetical protein ABZ705_28195 [Streptomyces sp. NPDC006984]|uniref:MmyB family transcriptional regulator n=1 Tax=Streptomyces sp. NPDC006984 TaxID=3155463 RepID=UPI0033F182C9